MKEKLGKEIEKNKEKIIRDICNLIEIPSISEENKTQEKMPFGKECNKALKYILNLGENLGFKTKNIDGYCGYIEFGEGEELIGIVGHLDVVPAEETDWKITKPFEPKIVDNRIYGRGAIDDKGPVIAALYAMKAVKDNIKTNKRIRLIIGLNEEKDWKCMKYYKEKEEIPNIGFSPDADFPCIYAEKGIINTFIKMKYNQNEDITIQELNCNNNAMNVVPKFCECKLKYNSNIENLEKTIKKIIEENNSNIKLEKIENNQIKIISYGISSHAAHPDLGKNAITELLMILSEIYRKYNISNELIEFFNQNLKRDYNGNILEINKKDESGELTLNIARFDLEENILKIGMNLRVPIYTQLEFIKDKFKEKCSKYNNLKVSFYGEMEHLLVPKDSMLVKKLTQIFNDMTNKNVEPIAIGGATYARAFPNFVSFGANMPGEKDLCHQTDENIKIDNLIISAKIYANAIYELDKLK